MMLTNDSPDINLKVSEQEFYALRTGRRFIVTKYDPKVTVGSTIRFECAATGLTFQPLKSISHIEHSCEGLKSGYCIILW